MATEIERKFLVVGNGWRDQVRSASHIRQGYLSREGRASVRCAGGSTRRARLTIKAAKSRIARHEFEYEIPIADGLALLEFRAGHLIDKVRHRVEIGGRQEVDVFEDENAGLIIAEIELKAESDALELPSWVGREITEEGRYYNAALPGAVQPLALEHALVSRSAPATARPCHHGVLLTTMWPFCRSGQAKWRTAEAAIDSIVLRSPAVPPRGRLALPDTFMS